MTTVSHATAGAGPVEPAKLSALSRAGLRSDADPAQITRICRHSGGS